MLSALQRAWFKTGIAIAWCICRAWEESNNGMIYQSPIRPPVKKCYHLWNTPHHHHYYYSLGTWGVLNGEWQLDQHSVKGTDLRRSFSAFPRGPGFIRHDIYHRQDSSIRPSQEVIRPPRISPHLSKGSGVTSYCTRWGEHFYISMDGQITIKMLVLHQESKELGRIRHGFSGFSVIGIIMAVSSRSVDCMAFI